MIKLLIGILVVTAVTVTTGYAAAQNNGGIRPELAGYTKDQCKNSGWQQLGFRNQGQCVSYFASNGRAPGN